MLKKRFFLYQRRLPSLFIFLILFLLLLFFIFFAFFGVVAALLIGVFTIGASILRYIFPNKNKIINNRRYDPNTQTITLDENDYEIVDKD